MSGFIKTHQEIERIGQGGKIMHRILQELSSMVKPGVNTYELNAYAHEEIIKSGGRPSFFGYGTKKNPFPAAICTSVNDVVVHGIPSKKVVLQDGDIIGIDIGMEYLGLYTDTAITVPVGNSVTKISQNLIHTAKKALDEAIKQVKPGNRIGDISSAIQRTTEAAGFSVVRELVGHGVGYEVHEDPAIPCFGKAGTGMLLKPGMVIAIEPMICEKSSKIYMDKDGWTIRTQDGGSSAHFEHTMAVTEAGVRVLT